MTILFSQLKNIYKVCNKIDRSYLFYKPMGNLAFNVISATDKYT